VLTGGELPALILIDAISRFIPRAGRSDGASDDSHASGLLNIRITRVRPNFAAGTYRSFALRIMPNQSMAAGTVPAPHIRTQA